MRFAFRGGHNPVGDRISARSQLENELPSSAAPKALTGLGAFPTLGTGRAVTSKSQEIFPFPHRHGSVTKAISVTVASRISVTVSLVSGKDFLLESGGLPMTCGWHTVAGHPWGSARTA